MSDRSLNVQTGADSVPTSEASRSTLKFLDARPMTGEQRPQIEHHRRESFITTLAHELRQPLAALMASVEVVRLNSSNPVTDRATAIMMRQIGLMDRVVEDLLDEGRWARGKVTLHQRCVDVRDVVAEAADDVAAAVAERGHELMVTTASEPLLADVDAARLHQVLSNLLRNAIRYTEPGGRIVLTAQRETTTIRLRVSDAGRGIAPEALTHIFELFSQVHPADAVGVGIGLSVGREIVALHGGRIVAKSQGADTGSEFIITLPLALPHAV
jgi:signal transduction histidine kinase